MSKYQHQDYEVDGICEESEDWLVAKGDEIQK